jgi:hypothetical protein
LGFITKKGGEWVELLPEVVNWRTGGVLESIATAGLVRGDINGVLQGANSRNSVKSPVEILIYAPEGVARRSRNISCCGCAKRAIDGSFVRSQAACFTPPAEPRGIWCHLREKRSHLALGSWSCRIWALVSTVSWRPAPSLRSTPVPSWARCTRFGCWRSAH